MKIVYLHDMNNPNNEIPLDARDFSTAFPYLLGSAVRLKSSDSSFPVHEKPLDVVRMVREALES
jgi:hypothetical protein